MYAAFYHINPKRMMKTTNTEILASKTTTKRFVSLHKTLTSALYGVLIFANVSCGQSTPQSIMEQEQKIEEINFKLSNYIKARNELAKDYNKLRKLRRESNNKQDINLSLAGTYETILEYDEIIKELMEDKLESKKTLIEQTSDTETFFITSDTIPTDRWNHLLEDK